MSSRSFGVLLLGAASLLFLHCGGTEAGNPEENPPAPIVAGPEARQLKVEIGFVGYKEYPSTGNIVSIQGGGTYADPLINIQSVQLNIESVRLFSSDSHPPLGPIHGPYLIDLLWPTYPSMAWDLLLGSDFRKVDVLLAPGNNQDPKFSLRIAGRFGLVYRPFEILFLSPIAFHLKSNRADGKFPLHPTQTNKFFVAFNVASWLPDLGITLNDLELSSSIIITDESNSRLMKQIRKSIISSCRFFADTNGDGILTSDEWNNPADVLGTGEERPINDNPANNSPPGGGKHNGGN